MLFGKLISHKKIFIIRKAAFRVKRNVEYTNRVPYIQIKPKFNISK